MKWVPTWIATAGVGFAIGDYIALAVLCAAIAITVECFHEVRS